MNTTTDEKIIIGRFGSAHGVRGEIRVQSHANPPENILIYTPWYIRKNNTWSIVTVTHSRTHQNVFLVKIEGVSDRDQAKHLTNQDIFIDRKQLPALPDGNYYWSDLIGLQVIDQEGNILGIIDHILETGSNDILVVINGKEETFLPYTDDVIQQVDLEQKRIRVHWEGMV